MLSTPGGPPGPAPTVAAERPGTGPPEDGTDDLTAAPPLAHHGSLSRRLAPHPDGPAPEARAQGVGAPLSQGAGTVGTWVAHHQLGVALDAVGARGARALGVVPRGEREEVAQEVSAALSRSAQRHLDRAARAALTDTPEDAVQQAALSALDRAARRAIDEAQRANALTESAEVPGRDSESHEADSEDASHELHGSQRRPPCGSVRVLVTDNPAAVGGQWQVHHLAAQLIARRGVLTLLLARVHAAAAALEAELSDADVVDARRPAEATAAGGPLLTASSALASPAELSLRLLELTRSDLSVRANPLSVGDREVLLRGAAALAHQLGADGTVVADGMAPLDVADSALMARIGEVLALRADLAAATAGLAPGEPQGRHDRLVAEVGEALEGTEEDLVQWTRAGPGGTAPPLVTALESERHASSEAAVTHLLLLQCEGLTADAVSRSSVVGESGRVTHNAGAAVTWLLIDLDTGDVMDGGQETAARTVVQDLLTGRTSTRDMDPETSDGLPLDAQGTLEFALKFLALSGGIAALALAVIAALHLILG